MERGWRFWSSVDKSGDCWVWTGMVDRYGYGKTSWGKTTKKSAHRVSWRLSHGAFPPEGMTLDHLCRNRRCVRPDHLEVVTNAENIRRGKHGVLRTHCKRGHPLTAENLVPWAPTGAKWCYQCQKDWHRDNDRARRSAAEAA